MKKSNNTNPETEFKQFANLIHTIRNDSEIKSRVMQILKMDSYHRRSVLNTWLEHLHRQNAHPEIMQQLSALFDENIAKKILTLINNHQTLNN